ncbi:hypothetical protein Mal15_13280 [Stieleria maiorica]|uniref:Uncharacterized protein n=1 Tax=Stieleria maiorica TaxID=2795974 RepID=A0A5B9M9S6_9BACT|nr:hypothetical protein [Stieleria maiorica]QEF97289.1 hypothetical protein Mal15_13280 [Stieleria maiorica]
MNTTSDIIVASLDSFDAILADVRNAMELDVTPKGNVSIDDIVAVVAIHRNVIDDRSEWRKIRREVYARFASHEVIATRTLAAIPDSVRDEIAALMNQDVGSIAPRWVELDDATPPDHDSALHALRRLVDVCKQAKASRLCVMLRTNQPPNDFETAFNKAAGKRLPKFQKAFDSWNDSKKYEAHQRYNYYRKQGVEDCLDQVLRDFSRPKTSRLNLKTDQRKIRKYITKRVKSYSKSPSPALGDPGDPIGRIALEFDLEYEGFVDLVFDTRPDAAEAHEFVEDTGDRLELYHWFEGTERFACENLPLKITLQDGSKVVIEPDSDGEAYDQYVGEMLRETLVELRQAGTFSNLPIADSCVLSVGGVHTNYFWQSGIEPA